MPLFKIREQGIEKEEKNSTNREWKRLKHFQSVVEWWKENYSRQPDIKLSSVSSLNRNWKAHSENEWKWRGRWVEKSLMTNLNFSREILRHHRILRNIEEPQESRHCLFCNKNNVHIRSWFFVHCTFIVQPASSVPSTKLFVFLFSERNK